MNQAGWLNNKRILCVRPDNMGDLLMSSPAIAALKETYNAHITVLTSSMGEKIVPFIPVIDECIVADFPWVKNESSIDSLNEVIKEIRDRDFDAAFIFTVLSQNPLPSAMVCYLAGISEIYGYCRENPYQLINHWIPDDEPLVTIRHQVLRDLRLVEQAGASTKDQRIRIKTLTDFKLESIFEEHGLPADQEYIIIHPGVSELKRQYPNNAWAEVCREIRKKFHYPLVFTGTEAERGLAQEIIDATGQGCYNLAGKLPLNDFIAALRGASLIISVNTSTIHIAAGVQTPVIVLYAATNPQHTPWMVPNQVIYFEVEEKLRSRNEILRWISEQWTDVPKGYPSSKTIIHACEMLLKPVQHNSIG